MSDLTRIIVTGRISPKLRKVYGVVLAAQLAAIEAIRPGRTCEQVDNVARKIISKAGFGPAFGHGLGHGTGLEIHEAPRLAVGQKTKAAARHDRDRRAGNLFARLGRCKDRGRHFGHADRTRSFVQRPQAIETHVHLVVTRLAKLRRILHELECGNTSRRRIRRP